MKFAASQYKVNIMRPSFFVVGSKFYSTGSSLTGGRRSLCDEKLTPFLFLKGFFLFLHCIYVLAFSTLLFCSIYILTFPVFLSTFSFIQILSCSCCIIWNLYCKLCIFMLCQCWNFLSIFYCLAFSSSYSSALMVNPLNSSSLLSASLVLLTNL